MFRRTPWLPLVVLAGLGLSSPALADDPQTPPGPDAKYGKALDCKPIPALKPLSSPRVVISLDGLTLRLADPDTGFDRAFPIGIGVEKNGRSKTPTTEDLPGGIAWLRLDTPEVAETRTPKELWAWNYRCKIWWSNDDNEMDPVYAGLPYLRLEGFQPAWFAIHGPVTQATKDPAGGRLRRGYVSHGCIRMEAQDILTLYALTRGRKVPVTIQQAVERRPDGVAVDPRPWLLSECAADADCRFPGGTCRLDPCTGRGFCTAACDGACKLSRFGYPVPACVPDPDRPGEGLCVVQAAPMNRECKQYPGFQPARGKALLGSRRKADVCMPKAPGGEMVGKACVKE